MFFHNLSGFVVQNAVLVFSEIDTCVFSSTYFLISLIYQPNNLFVMAYTNYTLYIFKVSFNVNPSYTIAVSG